MRNAPPRRSYRFPGESSGEHDLVPRRDELRFPIARPAQPEVHPAHEAEVAAAAPRARRRRPAAARSRNTGSRTGRRPARTGATPRPRGTRSRPRPGSRARPRAASVQSVAVLVRAGRARRGVRARAPRAGTAATCSRTARGLHLDHARAEPFELARPRLCDVAPTRARSRPPQVRWRSRPTVRPASRGSGTGGR